MSRYSGWSGSPDLKKLLNDSLKAKEANKYHAVKKTVDGITFHSTKEARRYTSLKALQQAGVIQDLRLQVPFPLHVNGILITTWICDFVYVQGVTIFEDTKGLRTAAYVLKKKLFEAIYGVKILES